MKRSTVILLTALLVPATTVFGRRGDGAAPARVIKFFELSFSDPPSWTCHRQSAGAANEDGSATSEATPTGGPEESCLDCTLKANGSGGIVVTKAPYGDEETLPDSSAAESCSDVLMAKASLDSAVNEPGDKRTDGGEQPVDSGVPATSCSTL